MNAYVTGKFEQREIVQILYSKLSDLGYDVSYDWTKHKIIKPYKENTGLGNEYSTNEINGIADSDLFIYLGADKGHALYMTFGAALMSKKLTGKPNKIFVVGDNDLSHWFFNDLVIRKDNIDAVLNELK